MKNKKIISLAALAALLAILIFAWFFMKTRNEKAEADSTSETETSLYVVPEVEKDDVVYIEYTNESGTFKFERNDDGEWIYNSDSDFPLDVTRPNSMATTIASLTADREVVNGDEDSFGFDKPCVTLKAKYSDGSTLDVVFGNTNDFYDGDYYLKDNSTGKVYLVPPSAKVSFDAVEKSLISADSFPTDIDSENITAITVKDEVGTVNNVTDEENVSELFDLFNNLTFSSDRATYTADKSQADYGITEESACITVSYKKEVEAEGDEGETDTVYTDEEYVIYFGNSFTGDNDSTLYYYSVPSSKLVYTLSQDNYEKIMNYKVTTSEEETTSADE